MSKVQLKIICGPPRSPDGGRMSEVWNRSPLLSDTESVGHEAALHPHPGIARYRLGIWRWCCAAGARDPLHLRLPAIWIVELRCCHRIAVRAADSPNGSESGPSVTAVTEIDRRAGLAYRRCGSSRAASWRKTGGCSSMNAPSLPPPALATAR